MKKMISLIVTGLLCIAGVAQAKTTENTKLTQQITEQVRAQNVEKGRNVMPNGCLTETSNLPGME